MFNRNSVLRLLTGVTVITSLAAAGYTASRGHARFVTGDAKNVAGGVIHTWAKLADGLVSEVGMTMPLSVIEHPPSKPGTGPAGAFAVMPFPKEARQSTYFDHLEVQWNPLGHPPACCTGVAHFDFHFFGVPVETVRSIGLQDTEVPSPSRLPKGYFYPGVKESVPGMGVHAVLPGLVAPGHKMSADMIAGFWHGRMHFIEPMISREVLLRKRSFDMDVPMPKELGRPTRYPTTFHALYDPVVKAYRFVWGGFKTFSG